MCSSSSERMKRGIMAVTSGEGGRGGGGKPRIL